MRILHISTRLILGGSQENTVLSCIGQARLGHEVHLAFGPIYGPEGSLLARVETFNTQVRLGAERVRGVGKLPPAAEAGSPVREICMHVVPSLVREVRPLMDWRASRELTALVRALDPDVVHTHSSKAGILGRGAGWRVKAGALAMSRPRVVHTIHGPPFMPPQGGALRRWKTVLSNYAYTLAERWAARRCNTIVSVADAMTREFLRRQIGSPTQYTTVRSGMEIDEFLSPRAGETRAELRARLGVEPSAFVVGVVARLTQHKGHDDMLDAIGDDLKRQPAWRMLWVGDGWWRERLVGRAKSMGLGVRELDREGGKDRGPGEAGAGAQVILTGLVAPGQIPGLMRAMDVLAHPSYREGLPRTVPQALLAGACPVAYDADGTGEVCRDLQTGRLVRVGDVAGLGEAIRWCAAEPLARRALVERGQHEVQQAFSVEAMIEGLDRVYRGR
ncbi:MAG: glycosyltransferase [Tepidisphaera sp.]|nr:glycosyltransferase [Tepidisphaera sp.]